jgi:hypothetical protein
MPDVIFAGHGAFCTQTDKNFPKVRLPPDVTLIFWCKHGESLKGRIALFVEKNRPLSGLPEDLKKYAKEQGKDIDGIPEIIPGGSEIWNYRLTYPSGLKLIGQDPAEVKSSVYNPPIVPAKPANFPKGVIKDQYYCIVPPLSGKIADRGVPIIAMLAGYWSICKGNRVHWCACRSIKQI